MAKINTEDYRRTRLQAFVDEKFEGSKAGLGRALGYRDGAFVGQMLRGERAISEKTIAQIHHLAGGRGWFTDVIEGAPIELGNNPDYPAIRRVRFKLSAGASGFGIDFIDEDAAPIVFQREWFTSRGFVPTKLFAVKVINGSMEPGLHDGDVVVVNTGDTEIKDGEVYAMNYEGELVIKRLVRDDGQWWLASDNPDQRRHPRKVCGEDVFCVGRIVHKQSERI